MKIRKWTLVTLVLCIVLVASMALGACNKSGGGGSAGSGGASSVEGKVVGVIPITLSNGFHQAEKIWREKFAAEHGVTLKYLDGEFDQTIIVNNLDQLIAEGVDGIVLHTAEVDSVVAGVTEARKQNIPIIHYYLEVPNEIPFVAINEAEAAFIMGKVTAEKWIEFYPDIPIIYSVVDYIDNDSVQKMRTKPFIEGILSVAPDAKQGLIIDGGGTRDSGYKAAQDIIQGAPDTNVFYGASSDYSLAIWPALQEAGRGKAVDGKPATEILVGTDATGEEMKLLYDGSSSFKVTMGLTPKDNGKKIIDTIVAVMLGQIDPDKKVTIDTFDKEFDFWSTTIEDARTWYKDQYGMEPEF
jgi:ABC-type sugar transport system substrate-binding protein